MRNDAEKPEEKLPIFKIVNGNLVRIPDDKRDPNKRYASVGGSDGSYLREFTDEEEKQRDREEADWIAKAPQRTLEAEQKKKDADAFRASLKYEIRLIAFIDILGWTEALKLAPGDSEQTQRLGLALNIMRKQVQQCEWMSKISGNDIWPGDPQVTQFSDCLTISASNDYAGKSWLISTLGFLSTSLLYQGFLLRGGITIGGLYHQESMVFGPALLKAYELESRYSVYPRIILDSVLSDKWGQGDAYYDKDDQLIDHARTWRLSHDGFRFFDFLQPFGGAPDFRDSTDLVKNTLLPVRSLLIENLKLYAGNPGIWPKYVWLANYFNDVCSEYIEHGIEPIILDP